MDILSESTRFSIKDIWPRARFPIEKILQQQAEVTMDLKHDELDFIAKVESGSIVLKRRNGTVCFCPYDAVEVQCGSHCPHFGIEKLDIAKRKCSLILTCGKSILHILELVP